MRWRFEEKTACQYHRLCCRFRKPMINRPGETRKLSCVCKQTLYTLQMVWPGRSTISSATRQPVPLRNSTVFILPELKTAGTTDLFGRA